MNPFDRGPPRAARGPLRVPAMPTLWPHMLAARPRSPVFPFDASRVQYFYFARNAVWLAARQLGLEHRECLVPAYHHGVEMEALEDAGVRLRFYRVDDRMRPDLHDLESKIGPRTKGVYLIHYLGFPGPAAELRAISDRRGLVMLEDCALALLSCDGDAPLGMLGDVSIFCLYKTIPLPHGGALVWNRGAPVLPDHGEPAPRLSTVRHLAALLVQNLELRSGLPGDVVGGALRRLGRGAIPAASTGHVPVGTQHFQRAHVHLRMSPLVLRLALAQDLAQVVARRRANYALLHGMLRGRVRSLLGALPPGTSPLFYPLEVRCKDVVRQRLLDRGIETINFWRIGHPGASPQEFPEVARLRRHVLEVPIHQDLDEESVAALAESVTRSVADQNLR